MRNVCTACFGDSELIAFINAQAHPGHCDFCEANSASCIPVDELFDFFAELITLFKQHSQGTSLKSLIQSNWELFSTPDIATGILNHFFSRVNMPLTHAEELVDFTDDILENVGYWDKLKELLITQNRYVTDITELTDRGWDGYFSAQVTIAPGQPLYRARLHHHSGEDPYDPPQMFCPPPLLTTAGRANPSGIPYLYLSDNDQTVLYEIRAAYLDEISIGRFEVKSNLPDNVKIADFTSSDTLFHPNRVSDRIKTTLLKQKISRDLSKPMRRYDSELDYVPTQFICEFIKNYTGAHGIKFRSSLDVTGYNFVIFDQNLMSCTAVNQVRVQRVIISI
jgi:hypothetical protein